MLLCTALNKCTCETQNFDPQTRLSPPRWPPWRSAVLHSLCSKGGNWIQIWSLLPPRSIFVLVKVENRKRCLLKQFVIQTFLQEEILMAINSLQRSPVYGHDTDFTALLGIAFKLFLHLHLHLLLHLLLILHHHHIHIFVSNGIWWPGGIVRNTTGHIVAASTARWRQAFSSVKKGIWRGFIMV